MSNGYTEVSRIRLLGAPLEVHWSVLFASLLLVLTNLEDPLRAVLALASYLAILLIHEAGHAWMARRLGYSVSRIQLALFHGTCWMEEADDAWDDARIAWGGVLAQLAVAVPIMVLMELPLELVRDPGYLGVPMVFLGPVSLLIATFNLLPAPGLDGAKAWWVFPLWFRRRRRAAEPRREKRPNLRVLK